MTLESGSRLGPYEILSLIGAGGMGEVYKAKDTRLDRTVAIKVLPSHLAKSPERRERFEREARAVSSLNHPHICTLYDIGEQDGTHYLVMEYIEGETLADRLKKGRLPFDQALRHGIEIADALDKAHRQGVVHRDLKPGNIMLTKPGAKLLDFGLAKLKASKPGQDASALSALPTEQKPLTKEGSILGTFQYMAPEQLEGKEADARTDIFAFGSVLYEMVTGERAFEGKSQASLIGAIMNSDPPAISVHQPMTQPSLEHLVKRCLAKEPAERWQSAADIMHELKWVAEGGTVKDVSASVRGLTSAARQYVLLLALAAAVLASVVTGLAVWRAMRTSPPVTRTSIALPADLDLVNRASSPLTLSPDGSRVVYAARGDANSQLYLRTLEHFDVRPIPGTEGAHTPFFSPDGQWVGFLTDDALKKVSLAGGTPLKICDARSDSRGATWGPDDTIIFAPFNGAPLMQVPVGGGTPEVLTTLDTEQGDTAHRWPHFLPDGTGVLFTIRTTGTWSLALLSLDTNEVRRLSSLGDGVGARYVRTGHIVYAQSDAFLAVPFDLAQHELSGIPASMFDGVRTSGIGIPYVAISDSGSLVYAVGVPGGAARRELVWVDREGREEPLAIQPRLYLYPRISPDRTKVALDVRDEMNDVWIWDFTRETLTRLTFVPESDTHPIWTPDGLRVAFSSERFGGRSNLFWKAADGTGAVERLTEVPHDQTPHTFSPDGTRLVFCESPPGSRDNLALLSLDGERSSEPLLATEFDEQNPELSPDGRWLAYESNPSGQYEIYVRPFPNVDEGRWQISTGGGYQPLWGPDGRELFYRVHDGKLMAVSVQTEPKFVAGNPEIVLEARYFMTEGEGRSYDIAPDGQQFLMIKFAATDTDDPFTGLTQLHVVLNWFDELKRLVPVDN